MFCWSDRKSSRFCPPARVVTNLGTFYFLVLFGPDLHFLNHAREILAHMPQELQRYQEMLLISWYLLTFLVPFHAQKGFKNLVGPICPRILLLLPPPPVLSHLVPVSSLFVRVVRVMSSSRPSPPSTVPPPHHPDAESSCPITPSVAVGTDGRSPADSSSVEHPHGAIPIQYSDVPEFVRRAVQEAAADHGLTTEAAAAYYDQCRILVVEVVNDNVRNLACATVAWRDSWAA